MSQSIITRAKVFEDTIDGYFPLSESLRQMMERNRFDTALVRILHAPAMEIPGLKPQDPVPLFITNGHGCMIHQMTLIVRLDGNKIAVSGAGEWSWIGEHRLKDDQFSTEHRLAEPAFIRGIQLGTTKDSTDPVQNKSDAALSHENENNHLVLLHSSLVDSCIMKGHSSAVGTKIHIRLVEPDQCEQQELIASLVFEKEAKEMRLLHDLFSELQ